LNWRLQAMDSLEREDLQDLHYSAIVSLSQQDVRKLKNKMLENIKEYLEVVRPSKEEQVFSLCLDFFDVHRK
jgi:hypothetical protein